MRGLYRRGGEEEKHSGRERGGSEGGGGAIGKDMGHEKSGKQEGEIAEMRWEQGNQRCGDTEEEEMRTK